MPLRGLGQRALLRAPLDVIAIEIVSRLTNHGSVVVLPRCAGVNIRDLAARKGHPRR